MNKVLKPALVTLLGIATTGAGLVQDATSEEHAHETNEHAGARLLVSDADSSTVSVLDLASGEVLGSFSTPGAGGAVYASPSGQYGIVVHRGENRVSVIHSGLRLEDHGDYADLVQGAPYVVHTFNVGREPTHFWAHGLDIVIFNDADGTVALLDERAFGLSLEFTEVAAAGRDHGAAVLLGDAVLVRYYELGRADAYTPQGELSESFRGCLGLHGEATLGEVAASDCEDGVLLVHDQGGELSATKVENQAGAAEGTRVGTLAAHEGEQLLVLTADGLLRVPGADGGEVHRSIQVLDAVATTAGHGSYVAPVLAVPEGAAYVSVPAEGQIAEIGLDDLSVARRLDVAGTSGGLAVLFPRRRHGSLMPGR